VFDRSRRGRAAHSGDSVPEAGDGAVIARVKRLAIGRGGAFMPRPMRRSRFEIGRLRELSAQFIDIAVEPYVPEARGDA